MKPALFTLFALLLLNFTSAYSGERIGNSGDIRRYRVATAIYNAQAILWNLGHSHLRPTPNAASAYFLQHWSDLHDRLGDAETVWVVRADSTCLVREPRTNHGLRFVLNYSGCPLRVKPYYYLGEILKATFADIPLPLEDLIRSFNEISRLAQNEIIGGFGSDGDETGEAILSRKPIPETDLADPIKMAAYWERARPWAAHKVQMNLSMRPEMMRNFFGDLAPLMIEHGAQIVDEILKSPVRWDANQMSCSFTDLKPHSVLQISLGNCREIKSIWDLAWLMTHEAVHHLGISDEAIADGLANSLYVGGYWWVTD